MSGLITVSRVDTHLHNTRGLQDELEAHYKLLVGNGGSLRAINKVPAFVVDHAKLRRDMDAHLMERLNERKPANGNLIAMIGPRASRMRHNVNPRVSKRWSQACNEVVAAMVEAEPQVLFGMCSLPQSPGGAPLDKSIEALRYWVEERGFVGCYVDHNPSGSEWNTPPLDDEYWHPLWAEMQRLRVPGLIHVSDSNTPAQQTTADCYINGDTTAIAQLLLTKDSPFEKFPDLNLIVPHGGGALLAQWDRFRGLALQKGIPEEVAFKYLMEGNLIIDSVLHGTAAMVEYFKRIPPIARLGASETLGAVDHIDPKTGRHFDDTFGHMEFVREICGLSAEDMYGAEIGNALRVFPRLAEAMASRGLQPAPAPGS